MALSVTHTFVSAIPDDADATLVRPSNWNDAHALSGVLPVANGGTGITSFGTGIDVFLGTPSSANLAAALTDETGTGAAVFANTPTFVTPILGTPTSGNLANCTGYPVGSISGTVPATAGGTGQTTYAKGDILASPGSNTLNKLPVGTDTFVLTADAASTNGIKWAAASAGGTPAGSGTEIQYRNAGAFGAMAGTAWDNTNRSLTMTGATVTTSNPVLNMTQTWNAGAVAFTGLLLNVTNTASAAGSLLMDLQVGGTSRISLSYVSNVGTLKLGSSGVGLTIDGSGTVTGAGSKVFQFAQNGALGIFYSDQFAGYNISTAFLTPISAATWQFGEVDKASAVAQTTKVQSVAAGNGNVAGADWTFQGSLSNGSGIGGDIVFKLSQSSAGSGSQNTAAEHVRLIASSGRVKFSNAGSFSANGSVATVLGSLGPTGSHTAVQKWLTIVDNGAVVGYLPVF